MYMMSVLTLSLSVMASLSSNNPFNAILYLILSLLSLMLYTWTFFHKWLSLVIALIFIGGMMVMFMYVASISNNEKMKIYINASTFWLLLCVIFFFSSYLYFNKFYSMPQSTGLFFLAYFKYLLVFLVFFLLLLLLIVVKIVESFKGALKPKKFF